MFVKRTEEDKYPALSGHLKLCGLIWFLHTQIGWCSSCHARCPTSSLAQAPMHAHCLHTPFQKNPHAFATNAATRLVIPHSIPHNHKFCPVQLSPVRLLQRNRVFHLGEMFENRTAKEHRRAYRSSFQMHIPLGILSTAVSLATTDLHLCACGVQSQYTQHPDCQQPSLRGAQLLQTCAHRIFYACVLC